MPDNRQQVRQGGFAMIMVLCIGALFVALATALLFASSLPVANANRQLVEQEVYGLASTFSARLNTELTTYDKRVPARINSFGDWLNHYLHDPGNTPDGTLTFACRPDDLDGLGGADSLTVTLTKREGDTDKLTGGEAVDLSTGTSDRVAADLEHANTWDPVLDFYVTVSVTAKVKDQSFTYTQSYECNSHYTLYYTLAGHGTTQYVYNPATKTFDSQTGLSSSISLEESMANTGIQKFRKAGAGEPAAVEFVNRSANTDSGEVTP